MIHMYHPFDPAISAAVFARLAAIQELPPRRVVVDVPDLHPVRVVGRGDVRCVWLATSAAL